MLGSAAFALVILSYLATYWNFFADVILTFFLAWLLAFILSSPVRLLLRAVPRLPRVVAVVAVYAVLTVVLMALIVILAQALFNSLLEFIRNVPSLREQLPAILQPWADRLAALGFGQVDLVAQANAFLDGLASTAQGLVGPLQAAAVASIGVVGNVLIVFFLSVFMVIDSEAILTFILRLVPPRYAAEARLLEGAIGRSFGGFLRGQAIIGFLYAVVAFVVSVVLGLPYVPVITATAGVLMAIPFFGPFVAWVPPVLVAFVSVPDATVAALIGMGDRLVRGHEPGPAAGHGGRGRHPADRRLRERPHRLQGRRGPGRDLRPADRGRHQRRLHVLAAPLAAGPGPASPSARPGASRPARDATSGFRGSRIPRPTRRPSEPADPARPAARPRILVTNDDGIESRGLLALAQAMATARRGAGDGPGHEPERGRPFADDVAPAPGARANAGRRHARPGRSTARRRTRSGSSSWACSPARSTWSRAASTTARTSATTSRIPGP